MKSSLFLTMSLTALLLTGCSTPTRVDKGPITASTFSFVVPPPKSDPFAPDARAPIHAQIQNAISRNLQSKGLSRQAAGGDVTVAYLIVVGNNATTEYITTYFGDSRDLPGLENKAQNAYTGAKTRNYFEAGTLLVDIVDSRTNKLLKRAYVVRPILNNPSAEARAERIQEAVDEMLKDVRIAR